MSTKFKTSFICTLGKDAELKQIGNNNYITLNVAKTEHPEDIEKWKYKNSKRHVDDRVGVLDSYKPKTGIKFKSLWD